MKSIITAVLSWAFAALCAVSAVMLFPSVGSVLLAVTVVLALPIKPIRKLWDRLTDFTGSGGSRAKSVGKAALLVLAAVVSLALSANQTKPLVETIPADRSIPVADTVTENAPASEAGRGMPAAETDAADDTSDPVVGEYVINKNSKKFHLPTCSSVPKIAEKNREDVTASRDELIGDGYSPCGVCKP